MKMLIPFRAAMLATFAGAAFSLPVLAQADDYDAGYYDPARACHSRDKNARLTGGLIGAVVGGVIGSQVSGHGAREEGTAIGAVVGGLAGAGIGDQSVDCDKRGRRVYYNGTGYNSHYNGYRRPISGPYRSGYGYTNGYGYNNGYRTTGYRYGRPVYRSVRDRDDYHYDNRHGYNDRYYDVRNQLADVRYRLTEYRREDRYLDRRGYRVHPELLRRHLWLEEEIERLEKKERRLEKRLRRY